MQLGADLVSMFAIADRSNICGVGYVGGGASWAYTVVNCFDSYTLAHEIGHNAG